MHNVEVSIMGLNKEREVALGRRRLEEARQLAELSQSVRPERSSHAGVLKLVWRVVDGVLHSRWIASGPHRGEREPRIATADALGLEVPGGR